MSFPSTEPRIADSDNNLLFKICQELSNQNGGAHPPRLGDSDNNLLFKIAHLVILDGTGDAACTAALAACNLLTASQAAQIIVLTAQIAANPQNMKVEWTPTSFSLGDVIGYTNNAQNWPGVTSITFKESSTISGFNISNQTTLTSLSFPNLAIMPSTALFTIASDSVLASLSFGSLTTINSLPTIATLPALSSLLFPALTTVTTGFTFTGPSLLTSLSFPSWTTHSSAAAISFISHASLASFSAPLLTTAGRSILLNSNPALTSINLASLVTLPAGNAALTLSNDTSLTTLSLPAFTTLNGVLGLNCSGCTVLANVSFPNYLPTNGTPQTFTTCALTAASVNHILARAVANAAYVSGTINTSGGTSSAPTGQGIIDKAALILRGVTVTTN